MVTVIDQGEDNVRDAHVAGSVSRHTALVRNLRLAIPALAVGLVITYAMSATPPRVDRAFAEQFSSVEDTDDGVKLAQPRYAGEDLEGRPFEMAASTATRGADDQERVALDNPVARRTREDGQESLVRARDGLYDQTGKTVDLKNDVEFEQRGEGGSFVLKTDAAKLDLDNQVVRSEAPVRGEGDGRTVEAGSAILYQNEDRVVLEGGVRFTLEGSEAGEEPAEDADDDEQP